MKLCLAPDCAHRAATGQPAEYRDDVQVCGDCGRPLVEGDLAAHIAKPPLPHKPPWKLVAVGLVLLGASFGLGFVPIPGFREGAERLWEGASFFSRYGLYSLVALGIMPLVSSLALVEQGHALWWWIRGRRHLPRPRGRGWWWTVLALTVAIATIQAWGLDLHLKSLSYQYWRFEAIEIGALWSILRIGTLVLGAALLMGIAALLGRVGLGHGVALLLGFSAVMAIARDAVHALRFGSPAQLLALATILGASVAGLIYLRRQRPTIQVDGLSWRLNPLAGGLVPIIVLPALLLSPINLANLLGVAVPRWLYPGSPGYLALGLATVVGFGVVYTALTWRPRHRLGLLVAHGIVREGSGEADLAFAQLTRHRLRGGALTIVASAAVLLVGYALNRVSPLLGGSFHSVLLLALVGWDLWAEWLGRRTLGPLRVLSVTQDYEEATLIEARLEAAGVRCVIRNEHLRSIATFAGPHLPLVIQVPEEAPVAQDIRARVSGAIL